MRRRKCEAIGVLALAAAFAAALASPGCSDPPPPLFDGARPFAMSELASGGTPPLAEVERLLERLVEVYGGSPRLARLRLKRVEDLYLARTGNPLGNELVATTWVRPDETVRTLLAYSSGETEERAMLRGERWLRPRFGSLIQASGASQQHVEWDWEVARLPGNLLEAEELRPLVSERVADRVLIGVAVKLPGLNPSFEAWIDPEGPLLAEVRTRLPITADLSMKTSASHRQVFSEHRRVDGVLLPHRREIWVEGERIGLGEVREFLVDVEIPDAEVTPTK
ncbi:MAG: hypothetical protein EXS13_11195 [Planctomycetes bacterium]|nr:hypothetical protein [Planctomycetota bacterium]